MKKIGLPIGAALLFTVFTVIMLSSFAALAISSAKADLALTERALSAMEEYYSLDSEAQQKLDEIEKTAKEGENINFAIEGEHSTLNIAAEMKNGRLEITQYRQTPVIEGEYGDEILELWDGN